MHVRWDGSRVAHDQVIVLRDALRRSVAASLTEADPEHAVDVDMVDVEVRANGPDDVIAVPVLVTVLARSEPLRRTARHEVAARLHAAAIEAGAPEDVMVELVLTDRTSAYRYGRAL